MAGVIFFMNDFSEEAKALIEQQNPEGQNFRLSQKVPDFQGGSLYIVNFYQGGRSVENYVLEKDGALASYRNQREFFFGIANTQGHSNFLVRLTRFIGVPGLIAVFLTITVCAIAYRGDQIPEILGTALATIIGYYFGTRAGDR